MPKGIGRPADRKHRDAYKEADPRDRQFIFPQALDAAMDRREIGAKGDEGIADIGRVRPGYLKQFPVGHTFWNKKKFKKGGKVRGRDDYAK